jgi:hypothetical protein
MVKRVAAYVGLEVDHCAFRGSDAEFDAIFGRIKEAGIPYSVFTRGYADKYATRRGHLFQGSQRPRTGASDPDLIGKPRRVELHAVQGERSHVFGKRIAVISIASISRESRLFQSSHSPMSSR